MVWKTLRIEIELFEFNICYKKYIFNSSIWSELYVEIGIISVQMMVQTILCVILVGVIILNILENKLYYSNSPNCTTLTAHLMISII